ncbi:MAG: aminopeptidase P family protein [Clostridia bacterium]|nr:aminopeptidase P family protein [Clostridia bacterium]
MYTKLSSLLEKYDGILLTSPYNMRYFSGFSGGEGAVWISSQQKVILTDSRYTEQAQAETEGFSVRETSTWMADLSEIAKTENAKSVLFEDEDMNTAAYLKLADKLGKDMLCAGSGELNSLRMVKNEAELKIMARAEEICCRAFERILEFIKPGVSEKTIAAELEYYMKQEGGEGTAFDTIAISGARCSLPHGVPTDKKIEKGDFVTMDFGCVLSGYCSDMTRTIVVGRANSKQKEVYNAVRKAQQAGLDCIRAGIKGSEADKAARSVVENAGYGDCFRHSLGHGVGLLVHEMPNLSPKSDIVFQENMVVTCEPGIYIPDFGGVRIEDMICIKNDGNLNFTQATKELVEL